MGRAGAIVVPIGLGLLIVALLVDTATWGGGLFGNRGRVSSLYDRD